MKAVKARPASPGKKAAAEPTKMTRGPYKVHLVEDHAPTHPRSRHSLARRWIQIREALGLTQSSMARQLNMPRSGVSQIESAIVRPSLQSSIALKDYARVTLDWIYLGDESGLSQATLDMLRKVKYDDIPMPHGTLPPGRKGTFR